MMTEVGVGSVSRIQTSLEQGALKVSIALTLLLALIGVAIGLFAGSQAIIFDGMYSFVDVLPTFASLAVAMLLARGGSRRFQFGYFFLKPAVAAFGASLLTLACIYAILTAIDDLISGGHDVSYGIGAIWAGILSVVGLIMFLYMKQLAARLGSSLLALDARSWAIGASATLALLAGFLLAWALRGTHYENWIPYVDSIALLVISLAMLPAPFGILAGALREILHVAPDELDRLVRSVMDDIEAKHGFLRYSSHVAKVGRARFVEIYILVPPDYHLDISAADRIRHEVAERVNAQSPGYWLTIEFTADPSWL